MPESQGTSTRIACPRSVAIVGTLPPLRAISSYCEGLAVAQARYSEVEFFSFHALYPGFLYPGGALEDPAANAPQAEGLHIHRTLSWYNPLSWLAVGLRLRGRVLNLQWWSLPLAPVLLLIGGIARLRGIPIVTTVHNVEPHDGGSRLYRLASRLLYRLSDRLIVHSQENARHLRALYPVAADQVLVSRMGIADFAQGRPVDRRRARERLGLPPARPILLMFGALRDYKGLPDALRAMTAVAKAHDEALLLVAGQAWGDEGRYRGMVDAMALDNHVRFDLRYIPETEIHDYFSAADLLLLPYTGFSAQSGAGISALAYGLPIVASRCGSLPELVADEASLIAPGDHAALARRLIALLGDPALLASMRDDSRALAREHSWDAICARLCTEYQVLAADRSRKSPGMTDDTKTLYIDATATRFLSINTGIQRVVRNIVGRASDIEREFGIRCVPVFCTFGYFWAPTVEPPGRPAAARSSFLVALGTRVSMALDQADKLAARTATRWPAFASLNTLVTGARRLVRTAGYAAFRVPFLVGLLRGRYRRVRPAPGDILLLPDAFWAYDIQTPLAAIARDGVAVVPVIHDLIPIEYPEYCSPDFVTKFQRLLHQLLTVSTGVITVSDVSRQALQRYLTTRGRTAQAALPTRVSHLGSDIRPLSIDEVGASLRDELQALVTSGEAVFLMVGTIEPRKGHDLVFDAMNAAWEQGSTDHLLIVGRIGWMCEDLIRRMKTSPWFRRRLHIYHDVEDQELGLLYQQATALIFASQVEGFGLPLVEAMQQGLPVIASDIPIFHEIGGDYPRYFSPQDRLDLLANLAAVRAGIDDEGAEPRPRSWQTWDQAISGMVDNLLAISASR